MVSGADASNPSLAGGAVIGVGSRRRGLGAVLRTEGLLIGCVAMFAGVVALRLGQQVSQDTWVSLVSGRRVAQHGIPHHDVLTAWTLGHTWVDQQWLAQLLMYGLYSAGGLVLLALLQVACLGGSVAWAAAYARRRGVAARTIAWLLVASIYPILLAAGSIRTQTLVLPLFVALLVLLVDDARSPSSKVFLALPILVVWANLHGSVVIAAGLVVLRALLGLGDKESRARYAALALGAALAVFATPYGFGIVGYYHDTLVNPAFRNVVTEWQAPTPSLINAPIFVLVLGAVWLLARNARTIGRFGLLAELALIVLALDAVRSVVWLGLATLVLLAPALDAELGGRELAVEKMNRAVAVVGVYFVTLILVVVLWHGDQGLLKWFPRPAGDTVAAAAASPNTRVYSNERFADWLLFEHPELAGRVAFDARFELLSGAQLLKVFHWTNQVTDDWRAAAAGSRVIVLDMSDEQPLAATLRKDAGLRRVYQDTRIAVFVRKAA